MVLLGTRSCLSIMIVFINIVEKSQAQFTVQPESVVQAKGLDAVFHCLYPGTAGENWFINGTLLTNTNIPPGVTRTSSSGDTPGTLAIPALPQYNNTAVQCEVTVREGGVGRFVFSTNATVVIKDFGPLSANLPNSTSVVISWDHIYPLSVDYYVDVRGSGGAIVESQLVDINSSMVEFMFTSPVICDQYNFTVTPTNGTANSTFIQQEDQYLSFKQSDVDINCLYQESDVQCNVEFEFPLADGVCDVELVFEVSDGKELSDNPQAVSINLIENGDKVYQVGDDGLLPNRFYIVNTGIMMGEQRTVISTQNITTHDILDATASGSENGSLTTSPTYVNNTKATGCLIIVSDQTCSESTFLTVYDTSGTPDTLEGVGEGNHKVTFFDIESNGMPMISGGNKFTGAADVEDVSIQTGNRASPFKSPSPNHVFMPRGKNEVCVNCSSDCLVLLYNCENPRAIVSLNISEAGHQCIPVQLPAHAGYYIGALFNFSNSELAKHPAAIQNFTFDLDGSSSTTPVATSTDLMSTSFDRTSIVQQPDTVVTIVFVACGGILFLLSLCVLLLILCCCFWRRRRSKESQTFLSHTETNSNTGPRYELGDLQRENAEPAYDTTFNNRATINNQESAAVPDSTYDVAFNTTPAAEGATGVDPTYDVAFAVTAPENKQEGATGVGPTYDVAFDNTNKESAAKQQQGAVPGPTYDLAFSPSTPATSAAGDGTTGLYSYAVVGAQEGKGDLIYSDVKASSSKVGQRPMSDVMEVQYAVLDSNKLAPVSEAKPPDPKPPEPVLPPKPTPLTVENLHAHLTPAAEKWVAIGRAMGIQQGILDQIEVGNSTDWLRLGQLCSVYVKLKCSWTEVIQILWIVEEWELADAIRRRERIQIERPLSEDSEEAPPLPPRLL